MLNVLCEITLQLNRISKNEDLDINWEGSSEVKKWDIINTPK